MDHLPGRTERSVHVFVERRARAAFLDAAVRVYEEIGPGLPYPCFGVLVGRMQDGTAHVERVAFGRNVRATDTAARDEFTDTVIPRFGAAYENPHRGYWCDSADLLRIVREAQDEGCDVLGSIHLHPDWHNIGSPDGTRPPLSEEPTRMDAYVFAGTGWPVNLICYLERRGGTFYHTWGGWAPRTDDPAQARCEALPVRLALPGAD